MTTNLNVFRDTNNREEMIVQYLVDVDVGERLFEDLGELSFSLVRFVFIEFSMFILLTELQKFEVSSPTSQFSSESSWPPLSFLSSLVVVVVVVVVPPCWEV